MTAFFFSTLAKPLPLLNLSIPAHTFTMVRFDSVHDGREKRKRRVTSELTPLPSPSTLLQSWDACGTSQLTTITVSNNVKELKENGQGEYFE